MVTIKRYFGQFKKPLHWRGRGRFVRFAVLPAVVAVVVLMVVRSQLVTQYVVPANRYDLDLLTGDRVAVWRPAYGWRTPLPGLFGEHCVGRRDPARGDLVAFSAPDGSGTVLVERITGLPGDTVALPPDTATTPRRAILPPLTYSAGSHIVSHEQLVGRLVGITYSVDPDEPFYRCLRRGRFLLKADYD